MRQAHTRLGLLAFGIALLIVAGLPLGAERTTAAPLRINLTSTATEPPTRTPTNTPVQPGATPVATNTPQPRREKRTADPVITKSASVSEARIGDEIVFTISVTNRGNTNAEDVVVNDTLPDYLDLIDVTTSWGAVATSGRAVTVTIGGVTPREEITIRIRARVNERAQPPSGRNGVTLTTSSSTDDTSNNSAEVTFGIIQQATATPALAPTPTAQPTPAPRVLPRTGDSGGSGASAALIAAIGLAAIALSLLLRRASG